MSDPNEKPKTTKANPKICFSYGLTGVTIPASVISIETNAFEACIHMTGIYFNGNAPSVGSAVFGGGNSGVNIDNATAYYLSGTTGWAAFATNTSLPTALWLPQTDDTGTSYGTQTNQFGFNINWAGNETVVIEACNNLANPVWVPVATNTISSGGTSVFSDSQSTNYPSRYYRIQSM